MHPFLHKAAALLLAAATLFSLTACTYFEEGGSATDTNSQGGTPSDKTLYVNQYPAPTLKEYDNYDKEDLSQYITLGAYEGIKVTAKQTIIDEAAVTKAIEELLATFNQSDGFTYYEHKYTDENGQALVVKEGDKVICDFTGYIDGKPFEGGSASFTAIDVKENNGFIPGFWEPFVDQVVGEEFTFDLAFPEDYVDEKQDPEMAALFNGVTAHWVITVRYVAGEKKQPTELTDEIAYEFYDYDTAEEFMVFYEDYLVEYAEKAAKESTYSELWKAVMDASEVKAYPKNSVEYYYQYMMNYLASYADYYGCDMEKAMDANEFLDEADVLKYCQEWVKDYLILYSLMEAEGIDPETGLDQWLEEQAETAGVTVEYLKYYYETYYGETYLKQMFITTKVHEVLYEKADVTVEMVEAELEEEEEEE